MSRVIARCINCGATLQACTTLHSDRGRGCCYECDHTEDE